VISADKMMNKAKGPMWNMKQKEKGITPKGLRGIDKKATWGKSNTVGWVYLHNRFSVVSHKVLPFLGFFIWMSNSGNEARKLWHETIHLKCLVKYTAMDSNAMIMIYSVKRRDSGKKPHHQLS
jgi:hypothetical protein